MLNMDDIGYMLFMSEQEKKESEKVNVKSFSSFGVETIVLFFSTPVCSSITLFS